MCASVEIKTNALWQAVLLSLFEYTYECVRKDYVNDYTVKQPACAFQ